MSTIGIIPARGGSKTIPRKNLRMLCGKPLIAWTIESARKASKLDRLICSTDDEEIAAVARKYGCEVPFMRPKELARDRVQIIAPTLHALEWFIERGEKYDTVVMLQCTSPFRTGKHIDGAIEEYRARKKASLISVSESDAPPYWLYTMTGEHELTPLFSDGRSGSQRQALPTTYKPNGAIFVNDADTLKKHQDFLKPKAFGFVMDRKYSLDIDCEDDWQYAEYLITTGRAGLL